MPDAELQTVDGKRVSGAAILIALDAPPDTVAQALSAQGLRAATFESLEQVPKGGDPLVIVLWTEEPSSSLARTVGSLVERFYGAPVVVVCASIERWGIRAALANGAAGVVLHDELDSAFGPCLHAVLAGQACVPRAHQQQLEPPALSAREKQILGLVVMGYMNSQIAEQLFLAESTVKSHLSSAFGKLGVRSRNEAVDLIVSPDSGLGLGILGLVGGEQPLDSTAKAL
jgi:DNA-binding NarL/FixJ family response regulator